MDVMAAMAREDQNSRGGRVKGLMPLGLALTIHLLLLFVLFLSRPPLHVLAIRATEISLIPGLGGRFGVAAQQPPAISATASSVQSEPSRPPSTAEPTLASRAVTPKPIAQPPTDLEPLVKAVSKSGPNLTSEPPALPGSTAQTPTTSANANGGKGCQIAAAMQASLQNSLEVKEALALIPAGSRSIANAIVLWNGQWIDAASVGGPDTFRPVARAILAGIGEASLECQAEIVHGVRFVILADARSTVVLAFGSEEWRWSDVAATLPTTMMK